jgi:hypothetical protein
MTAFEQIIRTVGNTPRVVSYALLVLAVLIPSIVWMLIALASESSRGWQVCVMMFLAILPLVALGLLYAVATLFYGSSAIGINPVTAAVVALAVSFFLCRERVREDRTRK